MCTEKAEKGASCAAIFIIVFGDSREIFWFDLDFRIVARSSRYGPTF